MKQTFTETENNGSPGRAKELLRERVLTRKKQFFNKYLHENTTPTKRTNDITIIHKKAIY